MFIFFVILPSLIPFVQSNVVNSSLRLYDSFAEVQQNYTGPLFFRQNDWDNIKHESILLRSLVKSNTTTFFERRILRLNTNLTGRTVFVRKHLEQKRPSVCELIHEEEEYSIVRNADTGRYMRVDNHLIEYNEEPKHGPTYEVSFHPIPINESLIISYAVNNLRWHARYILQTFANGQTKFHIFADIINTSPFQYHSQSIELMTGDFNLAFANGKSSSLTISVPSSDSTTDYSGIHIFSRIDGPLILEPSSIVSLPILSPNVQVRTIFTYNLVLTMPVPLTTTTSQSVMSGKHKFSRLYLLSNSSTYLPTGHLLLYDSPAHILTGEWQLPTLNEYEKYEFELGQDPDVMLIYNRTISVSQATNSSLITTHVLIQNYKQRRVTIRFKSACQLSMTCLFYDDKARSLGARLRYNLTLEAQSEVVFTYTAVRLS